MVLPRPDIGDESSASHHQVAPWYSCAKAERRAGPTRGGGGRATRLDSVRGDECPAPDRERLAHLCARFARPLAGRGRERNLEREVARHNQLLRAVDGEHSMYGAELLGLGRHTIFLRFIGRVCRRNA